MCHNLSRYNKLFNQYKENKSAYIYKKKKKIIPMKMYTYFLLCALITHCIYV